MNCSFSDRISNLRPSAIREIFKYASDPNVISLSAGNPDTKAFPSKEIAEISQRVLTQNPDLVLQYNITEGYEPLRTYLKNYIKEKYESINGEDDLMITSGAQQVMDLATKSLCNSGDTVICESPSFIGSLNTFRSYGVKLCGVPMEDDGINIELLEESLRKNKKVKFIYTIPNFQNPTGITMSYAKRKAVYELAKKYNVLILEDNPYGEIRFTEEVIPNIKSFDDDNRVIYAGTFSKVISPGMRVGFAIGYKNIIQKMIVCKQGEDVHTNIWAQVMIHEYMNNYNFEEHLEQIRKIYKNKANLMERLIDRYFDSDITYKKIKGGFFIWCTLPSHIEMLDFCQKAVANKVCVVPGNAFLIDEGDKSHSFRLNFSTPSDEKIEKGIKILGKLRNEIL